MTDNALITAEATEIGDASRIDIGWPVEWMVDPDRHDLVLGVTYVFSQTGLRRTVWYTANKRRPKIFAVVDVPAST